MSRRRLAILCMLFGIAPFVLHAAPIAYDESVDGDLPSSATEKTFDLGLGTNTIRGEAGFSYGTVGIDFSDFDSFTFVIQEGSLLLGGQLQATVTSGSPQAAEWRLTRELVNIEVWVSSFPSTVSIPSLDAGTYRMQHEGFTFIDSGIDALFSYTFELIVAPGDSVMVTGVVATPNPVPAQGMTDLTATAWSSANISRATWTLRGANTEVSGEMEPADGAFNSTTAGLYAQLMAPYEAGIYDLCVNATDVGGNVSEDACIDLVVYDPSAGFVTGGGWIWSPQGAMTAEPEAVGRANFRFISRYRRGANVPDGSTQFVFQAGDLSFHSNTYEWLVVTGNNYARFKGAGTVNGANAETGQPYQFMIWARDGDPDTFRIKIWYEGDGEVLVYDNGMGQTIGGGQIIVHTGGKKK